MSELKTFQNEQIEPEWIPSEEKLHFTSLPNSYRSVLLISYTLLFLVPALVFVGIKLFRTEDQDDYPFGWIMLGWAVITVFFILRIKVNY